MKKLCLRENQDKRRGDWREKREKKYDWIAIYFEETIHQRCSFYEQCLYDMASIETTNSVLGWDCPYATLQLFYTKACCVPLI